MIRLYFSDYFAVSKESLEAYGAFNVSLINDLPLFIDPFLLFNSDNQEYRRLHDDIIAYLRFLRDRATSGVVNEGLLLSWFTFPEVKQNWLGYSKAGNSGSGLGLKFARALHKNLGTVFSTFGQEKVTRSSHLEKLCLLDSGIGRDNISDFATNLIKHFLLEYTSRYAVEHINASMLRQFTVAKARFNYNTQTWQAGTYTLPYHEEKNDFVILTPKDLLTKDDTWISRAGFHYELPFVINSIPNLQLREQINNYLLQKLPEDADADARARAIDDTIRSHPELIEYYIKLKEDTGDQAEATSAARVAYTEDIFIRQLSAFTASLAASTDFYRVPGNTYDESRQRVAFLKDVIENKGGHAVFYAAGEPIRRESDVHVLFRLTWFGTPSDVSREVNDGRGPADFKVSRGAKDKTIVEFKRASNSKLKQNLRSQAEIYQRASDAQKAIKVIFYFSESELTRVRAILDDLGLSDDKDVVLVDARGDNKPSASAA